MARDVVDRDGSRERLLPRHGTPIRSAPVAQGERRQRRWRPGRRDLHGQPSDDLSPSLGPPAVSPSTGSGSGVPTPWGSWSDPSASAPRPCTAGRHAPAAAASTDAPGRVRCRPSRSLHVDGPTASSVRVVDVDEGSGAVLAIAAAARTASERERSHGDAAHLPRCASAVAEDDVHELAAAGQDDPVRRPAGQDRHDLRAGQGRASRSARSASAGDDDPVAQLAVDLDRHLAGRLGRRRHVDLRPRLGVDRGPLPARRGRRGATTAPR